MAINERESSQEDDQEENTDQEDSQEESQNQEEETDEEDEDLNSKDAKLREAALRRRIKKQANYARNLKERLDKALSQSNDNSDSKTKTPAKSRKSTIDPAIMNRLAQLSFREQSQNLEDVDTLFALANSSNLLEIDEAGNITNYTSALKTLKTKFPRLFAQSDIGGNGGKPPKSSQEIDDIIRGHSR